MNYHISLKKSWACICALVFIMIVLFLRRDGAAPDKAATSQNDKATALQPIKPSVARIWELGDDMGPSEVWCRDELLRALDSQAFMGNERAELDAVALLEDIIDHEDCREAKDILLRIILKHPTFAVRERARVAIRHSK